MEHTRHRALIVGAAPSVGAVPLLARVADGYDYVIAADGGGDVCVAAAVVPDLLIGDLDSVAAHVRESLLASGVESSVAPAHKDVTDLDLAFSAARAWGARQVTVMAAFSGRLDHTLGAFGSLVHNADLAPEILEPAQRGWVLDHRHRSELSLGGLGATVSLIGLCAGCRVTVTGVKWPLHDHELAPLSSLGVSNAITGEAAVVSVSQGCVAVLTADVGGVPHAIEIAEHGSGV